MDATRSDFTQPLLFWGTVIVLGHFVAVVWHLYLVLRLQPHFPRLTIPLLIFMNLLPVSGIVALAKGHRKSAATLITVPMAVALIIGVVAHFLRPGTDNVLHMPPGVLVKPFQVSAVLLVFLEALGCWVGLRLFIDSHRNTV
jgi:hypothetical protein